MRKWTFYVARTWLYLVACLLGGMLIGKLAQGLYRGEPEAVAIAFALLTLAALLRLVLEPGTEP